MSLTPLSFWLFLCHRKDRKKFIEEAPFAPSDCDFLQIELQAMQSPLQRYPVFLRLADFICLFPLVLAWCHWAAQWSCLGLSLGEEQDAD